MTPDTPQNPSDRLGSWKEIAAYLEREVRTAQRWERERGLPVHRIPGAQKGGVYTYRSELDAWLNQKRNEVPISRADPAAIVEPEPAGDRASSLAAAARVLVSAPWQLYVAAVPFLLFTFLTWWVHLCGPEQVGWTAVPSTNGYPVLAVEPGSAAARAGISEGDRILQWSGLRLYGFLRLGVLHAEIGRPYRLTVERGGLRRETVLTLRGKDRAFWTGRHGVRQLLFLLNATLYLVLGFVVAFARPMDRAARWGALTLGTIAISLMHSSSFLGIAGTFHLLRGLPGSWGALFWGMASLAGPLPAVMFTFLCFFPRRLIVRRWIWAAIWLPNLARVGILWYWLDFLTYKPEAFVGFGWTADVCDTALLPLFLCPLILLVWNSVRYKDGDLGRRAHAMLAGLAISLMAAVPTVVFGVSALPAVRRWTPVYEASAVPLALSLFHPAFAIAVAYAILRHRLFDIRLMVRQGLRYSAARGLLLSLAPCMAILLVGDLWLHRQQLLAETLNDRRWLYFVLGAAGVLLHWRRNTWLQALDERFFREQYDARRLLHAVAEEARRVRALDQVASHVVSHIEAALHPEFAAILVRLPGETVFRATAAVRQAPAPMPADSTLIGLVRVLGKPLEVSAARTGWLRRQLPPQEAQAVGEARLDWLFPIVVGSESAEALLVLGPKRSEEPYSREDQTLLEALTANLALLSVKASVP